MRCSPQADALRLTRLNCWSHAVQHSRMPLLRIVLWARIHPHSEDAEIHIRLALPLAVRIPRLSKLLIKTYQHSCESNLLHALQHKGATIVATMSKILQPTRRLTNCLEVMRRQRFLVGSTFIESTQEMCSAERLALFNYPIMPTVST